VAPAGLEAEELGLGDVSAAMAMPDTPVARTAPAASEPRISQKCVQFKVIILCDRQHVWWHLRRIRGHCKQTALEHPFPEVFTTHRTLK
jgi:hypothetical protein